MVGGDADAFAQVEPFLKDLTEEGGYALRRPSGSGHFVKMVHNGIEYGMMQSLAEGFEIMKASSSRSTSTASRALAARLGRPQLAARPARARAAGGSGPGADPRLRRRLGRGRWTGASTRSTRAFRRPAITMAAVRPFASRQDESFAGKGERRVRQQFGGHAVKAAEKEGVRKTARRGAFASADGRTPAPSVIFGASGDLTRRKLFPRDLTRSRSATVLPDRFAIVGVALL
jgi:6-phosphogluconate dehydrogenase